MFLRKIDFILHLSTSYVDVLFKIYIFVNIKMLSADL